MAKLDKKRQGSGTNDVVGLPATAAGPSVPTQKMPPKVPKKPGAKPERIGAARSASKRVGETSQTKTMPALDTEADRLVRLQTALKHAQTGALGSVRTHKLLGSDVPKVAQKLVEEAAEAAIEAVGDQRETFVQESADLLFSLAVLWQAVGIKPGDIWAAMDHRRSLLGLAEKLPEPDELS